MSPSEPMSQSWPLLMLFGLPDDRMVELRSISGTGVPDLGIPGTLAIAPFLRKESGITFSSAIVGHGAPPALPSDTGIAVVNNVADADVSRKALAVIEALVAETGVACFNHPRSVLRSTRDVAARRLGAIAGVVAPLTLRLDIADPADLHDAIVNAGLQFPVILRVAGTHGGTTTVRVDQPDRLGSAMRTIPWGGRSIYVSQFVPYAGDDGRHRKMRLMVAGEHIILRHLVTATDWHVHAQDRDMDAAAHEAAMLRDFSRGLLPDLRDRVLAIANVLDLDYFGIDCSLLPSGDLLVFEANASMNALLNSHPSPNCWDAPIQELRMTLIRLLMQPHLWRHPGKAQVR